MFSLLLHILVSVYLSSANNLENPQIEISEVENVNLDAQIVAERIATSLERFGAGRFKSIGHKVIEDVMNVIRKERPKGVIVQFGGQTAINLAPQLRLRGVQILGTTVGSTNDLNPANLIFFNCIVLFTYRSCDSKLSIISQYFN